MHATRLTPDIAERLLCARRSGATWDIAAKEAGIHRRYISRWRKAGEEGREPFATFARMLREIEDQMDRSVSDALGRIYA